MIEPEFPECPANDPFPETFSRKNENRLLDVKIVQTDRAKVSKGYRFKTFAEMSAFPAEKRWLIKGIIARGETSAWIAPPKALKSALLAEASVCVAAGLDWHGFKNKERAGVVYFALERADLVERRLLAHAARMGLDHLPIVVCRDTIDMTKPNAFKMAEHTLRTAEQTLGISIGLSIFDTFAKLIATQGGDENSAKDQGAVFGNVQQLKNATDCHAALIGHTGKDENKGARGSNAILGDVDLMVMLSGSDIRTATVTGANDAPEGALFSFKSDVHPFGNDKDGDPVTVNVVSSDAVPTENRVANEPKLSENQRVMFRLLHDAGPDGLLTEDWSAKAHEVGITKKQRLYELREALKDKGRVREYDGRWFVSNG